MEHQDREEREHRRAHLRHQSCFSEEVLLRLLTLVSDVLDDRKELSEAVCQLSRNVTEMRAELTRIAEIVAESAVNEADIARSQQAIDALSAKLAPVVAASQAAEDKLKDAVKGQDDA